MVKTIGVCTALSDSECHLLRQAYRQKN